MVSLSLPMNLMLCGAQNSKKDHSHFLQPRLVLAAKKCGLIVLGLHLPWLMGDMQPAAGLSPGTNPFLYLFAHACPLCCTCNRDSCQHPLLSRLNWIYQVCQPSHQRAMMQQQLPSVTLQLPPPHPFPSPEVATHACVLQCEQFLCVLTAACSCPL